MQAIITPVDFYGFPENKNTNENAIIKVDIHNYAKAHNSTCCSPISCNCPSAKTCFWDAFRKIASDPVGRVLLYRILIEVTRNTEANDVQAVAGIVNQHGDTLKHLVVLYSPNPEDAYYTNGKMKFSNKPMLGQQLLNKLHRGNNNYEICVKEDIKTNIVDITLIHEFLHWFHHLRSRVRYENYGAGRQANANAIVQGAFASSACCYFRNV
ncbi:MAG: hypothetical protein IJ599_04280 [Alphaproteobacteria bacterium]|nr:hypothetical protein [Alphaproteobacteria bacterium]